MRALRRLLPIVLLASAAAAAAQEPVQLRFSTRVNQSVRYKTDVDAWVRSPLLPAGDTALPTAHITMYSIRTIGLPDSAGRIEFIDRTDSSSYDMPAVRAYAPTMATGGDLLRGMRSSTTMDRSGSGLVTRVLETPNMPQDLPVLVKGIQGLAVTSIRMSMFSLPSAPIRVGDTWNDSLRYEQTTATGLQQTLLSAGGRGYATYRLERVENRAGTRVAVISAIATVVAGAEEPGQSASMQVSATAQMDFDIDAGVLIRSQMDLSGPMSTRIGLIPVRVRMAMQAL